jgi:hypothetical protein
MVVAALALMACSGERPTTMPAGASSPPASTTPTTPTTSFQPSVTVVLPAATPTTTSTVPASVSIASAAPDAPAPIAALAMTPSTVQFRPLPGSTGILVTEALGAQPITTSLDSGILVEGQADCAVLLSGHRTSGNAPLADVPDMRMGDALELQFRNGPTCRYEVRSMELISEGEAFRRVNLFSAADQAALYTCADPTGAAGGLSHRWWVGLTIMHPSL